VHKTFSTPRRSHAGPGAARSSSASCSTVPADAVVVKGEMAAIRSTTPAQEHRRLKATRPVTASSLHIRMHGADRVARALSETAVLNATTAHAAHGSVRPGYDRTCMHEFVLSGRRQKQAHGVRTLDIAKTLDRFLDSPTDHLFPADRREAIMIGQR